LVPVSGANKGKSTGFGHGSPSSQDKEFQVGQARTVHRGLDEVSVSRLKHPQ